MPPEREPIHIVTDSTADIPPNLLEKYGIKVVPAIIMFGNESYKDRIDMTMEEFLQRLKDPNSPHPTTGAPSPFVYQKIYEHLGKGQILSIHAGSGFSHLSEHATIAALRFSSG